jgi:hypothetical protein
MENSLGLAKFLQKLFWGLFFSLLVMSILIRINQIELTNTNDFIKSLSSFIQGISLIILITLLAIIGLKTQDLIIQIINYILSILNRIKIFNIIFKKVKLERILKSDAQLSKEIFINQSDDILRFIYLKSWAQPEVLGNVKGLELHCNNIKDHIFNLKDDELIVQFDYYSSITQEKAVKEQIRNNIREQFYMLINSILILILITSFFANLILIIVFVLFYLLLLTIILNKIFNYKRQLAYYIINGYIDCFTLGQGATIADRETNID